MKGSQCTVCWQVVDFKISHRDAEVVTSITNVFQKEFGEVTIMRGIKHVFVGMDFEIKGEKNYITMTEYLKECIEAFGEEVNKTSKIPAAANIFDVDESSERLDKDNHKRFHHIVAKLLYVTK